MSKRSDLSKINEYVVDFNKLVRGVPLSQWKKWAIEGESVAKITEVVGCSKDTVLSTYKKISHLLLGEAGLSQSKIQKKYRRDKLIELLPTMEPAEIVRNVFKIAAPTESNVRRFILRLFDKDISNELLTYTQLIAKLRKKNTNNNFLGDN